MSVQLKHTYKTPYAKLAAAIIESGVREHDTLFLESDWCDMLRGLCSLDDEMYSNIFRYEQHLDKLNGKLN